MTETGVFFSGSWLYFQEYRGSSNSANQELIRKIKIKWMYPVDFQVVRTPRYRNVMAEHTHM